MTKQAKLSGLGLAAVALVLYAFNTATYAYPNQWSAALGSIVGMDPFRPLSRPIWQLLMQVFSELPAAGILTAANYVNALFGALAVWLAFQCGYRLLVQPRFARTEEEQRAITASRLVAGMVTGAFVAVCMPMLIVSTRAHPLALDACLVLAVTLLTLAYRDEEGPWQWYLCCALYGIGLSEFPTFILLFPLFAICWSWLFWKSKKIHLRMILIGLALLAAGVAISLAFCWFYYKSTIAEWRQFDSYFLVYKHFIVDQVNELRFGVPKQGWLVVFLSMILPAVFVFKTDFFADHDVFTKVGLYSFRLILIGVAVVVLFNLPGSPWHVAGSNVLLVTPYLIAALWVGHLVAFLYHATVKSPANRLRRRHTRVSPVPRVALVLVVSVAFVAGGTVNTLEATPARGKPIAELSRDLLEAVGEADYLLSNGSMDVTMKWEAIKRGQDIRVMNPSQVSSDAFLKYMVTWFNDPALESVSAIGFIPFLNLWMSENTNITEELAIQGNPQIWSLQGFGWIPDRGVYHGATTEEAARLDLDALEERNRAFLEKHVLHFGEEADVPERLVSQARGIGRSLSVFANNFGFRLLLKERYQQAARMFELSLRYNSRNLSAMLNMGEVAELTEDEAIHEEYRDRYNRRITLSRPPSSPRELMRQYGYVRNHALFVRDAVAMVDAGLTEQGMRIIEESMSFDARSLDADMQIARVLFNEGRIEESLELYEDILNRELSNTEALAGAARCHLMLGDTEQASLMFKLMEEQGAPAGRVAMERGYVQLRVGNYAEALEEFMRGIEDEQSKGASAVGLVWAGLNVNDQNAVLKGEALLQDMPRYYAGQMTLYELAMLRENTDAAHEYIMSVLRLQPGNVTALERAIRLELLEGREAEAKRWLDRLLAIDSTNPYGNYLLSSIHEQAGRLDLAETALRRALRMGPRGDVLYGLAWVLEKQGRTDEALDFAQRAVRMEPGNPQYRAVEGIVLASAGSYAEAEEALRAAIEMRVDREIPLFELHLARALQGLGRGEEADRIIERYSADLEILTDDEVALLTRLQSSGD